MMHSNFQSGPKDDNHWHEMEHDGRFVGRRCYITAASLVTTCQGQGWSNSTCVQKLQWFHTLICAIAIAKPHSTLPRPTCTSRTFHTTRYAALYVSLRGSAQPTSATLDLQARGSRREIYTVICSHHWHQCKNTDPPNLNPNQNPPAKDAKRP